jgi:Ni,Fe-hydrogenase I small subunit
MFEWEKNAAKILIDAIEDKYDPFVLILEGAIPDEGKAGEGVLQHCKLRG